ncbi:CCHC-type domain-containing protein [Trichonephila clavipes]|nr:CCHC-type domain-containing protein [Trichonephila clavipes]
MAFLIRIKYKEKEAKELLEVITDERLETEQQQKLEQQEQLSIEKLRLEIELSRNANQSATQNNGQTSRVKSLDEIGKGTVKVLNKSDGWDYFFLVLKRLSLVKWKNLDKGQVTEIKKFACFTCGSDKHFKRDCPKNKEVDNKRLNVNKVSTEGTELVDGTVAARVDVLGKVIPRRAIEDKLSKLVKTSISVDGKLVHALLDSAVKCPLVYVPIGLATGGQVNVVHQQVLCALAEVLVEDVLLPPEVLDMLGGAQSEENSLAQSSQNLRVDSGNVDETEVSLVGTLGTKDEEVTAEMDKGIMVADSFRSEQECCAELALVWKQAKEGKGNYYEVDGYLFRRDKILGESIGQHCERPRLPSDQDNGLVAEKLTVGALYGLVDSVFKIDEGHNVTVNGDRYRAMITNFFIPELNNHDVQELWFQQDGATCHTARATIDLLKDTLGDRLISRFGPVNWPSRSCDLTPLDYFLWGYVKSLAFADKPQTLDHLDDNIRRVIADTRPQMLEKSSKIGRPDWTTSEPAVAVICQKSYLKFKRVLERPDHRDLISGWSMGRVAGEQWTREGTHVRITRSGVTRKTTRREDRRIVRQALVDPTATRSTIRADVGVAIVHNQFPDSLQKQILNPSVLSVHSL